MIASKWARRRTEKSEKQKKKKTRKENVKKTTNKQVELEWMTRTTATPPTTTTINAHKRTPNRDIFNTKSTHVEAVRVFWVCVAGCRWFVFFTSLFVSLIHFNFFLDKVFQMGKQPGHAFCYVWIFIHINSFWCWKSNKTFLTATTHYFRAFYTLSSYSACYKIQHTEHLPLQITIKFI